MLYHFPLLLPKFGTWKLNPFDFLHTFIHLSTLNFVYSEFSNSFKSEPILLEIILFWIGKLYFISFSPWRSYSKYWHFSESQ